MVVKWSDKRGQPWSDAEHFSRHGRAMPTTAQLRMSDLHLLCAFNVHIWSKFKLDHSRSDMDVSREGSKPLVCQSLWSLWDVIHSGANKGGLHPQLWPVWKTKRMPPEQNWTRGCPHQSHNMMGIVLSLRRELNCTSSYSSLQQRDIGPKCIQTCPPLCKVCLVERHSKYYSS